MSVSVFLHRHPQIKKANSLVMSAPSSLSNLPKDAFCTQMGALLCLWYISKTHVRTLYVCSVFCLFCPKYHRYHPKNQPRNLKSNLNMYNRETQQQKGRLTIAFENAYARALLRALHNSKQCLHIYIYMYECSTPNAIAVLFPKAAEKAAMSRRPSHLWRHVRASVRALHFKTMLTHVYIYIPPQTPQMCRFKKLSRQLPCLAVQVPLWRYFSFCANMLSTCEICRQL
jgi:hypothetical protein